ncbi:S-adenosyl-L-methionine-dependent methyltransferase [Pyronema omphalodes]|nr:S-adenosyl-L-methionine-dependent methyltransferase [Pyronema omphalodes]
MSTESNTNCSNTSAVGNGEHSHIHNANIDFFDKLAPTYGHGHSHQSANKTVIKALLSNKELLNLDEDNTRVLDYACGTGMISQSLLPHIKSVVGMDISPGMIEAYNKAAENQGLERDEMHAVLIDLCNQPLPEGEEYRDFDIAICSFAFHHIPQPEIAAQKMAALLKKGGKLVVVDFHSHLDMTKTPGGEAFKDVVVHNGFDTKTIKSWFTESGCAEPTMVEVGNNGAGVTIVPMNPNTGEEFQPVKRSVFVAVGIKL